MQGYHTTPEKTWKLALQLSLKENQKRTLVIKEKDTWYLNGFPTGSKLELTVIVGEIPTTTMYTYINHHAQPPIIPQHNHSSYGYNPTIDNSTIETTRNRGLGK